MAHSKLLPVRVSSLLVRSRNAIAGYFAAAPGTLKNHLNADELARVTVSALAAGGGIFAVLEAIVLHAGTIFPAPTDAALAGVALTLILEALRRLGHGDEPPASRRPDPAR
jgi:hypothetical protein